MGYPTSEEEKFVLTKNTTTSNFDSYNLKPVLSPERIVAIQEQVKEIFTSDAIENYIIQIVAKTRDEKADFGKYVSYGASPRASIALYISSKAEALMQGRDYVIPEDVQIVAYPILRHRIILNYEAEAEQITTDKVIKNILSNVNVP